MAAVGSVRRRVGIGGVAVRRITGGVARVAVRRITITIAIRWITRGVARVAVRRITVTVAIRRITIAVGRRRDRATNYACGNAGTDPATQTPRLRRSRGSEGRPGNAGSRDDGRNYLTHERVLNDVASGGHFKHEGNLNGTLNHTGLGNPPGGPPPYLSANNRV